MERKSRMKRERIVGLCICVLILGSLQAQNLAGNWQFSLPSLPQVICAFSSQGAPDQCRYQRYWALMFPTAVPSSYWSPAVSAIRNGGGMAGYIAAAARAAWPQFSLICDEIRLIQRAFRDSSDKTRRHTSAEPAQLPVRPNVYLRSRESLDSLAFSLLSFIFPEL